MTGTATSKYKLIEPLICVKILIQEVSKRPLLWTSGSPKDLPLKRIQWGEVAWEAIGMDKWQTFDTAEKNTAIQVVQKRFKNMRTCYYREARRQQYEMEHMCANKKRRPYLYFKELSFLSGNGDVDADGEDFNSSESTQIDGSFVEDGSGSETDNSEKITAQNKSSQKEHTLDQDEKSIEHIAEENQEQPNPSNNNDEFCECEDVKVIKAELITNPTDTDNEEAPTASPAPTPLQATTTDQRQAISLISKLQLLQEYDEHELFLMSLLPRLRSLDRIQQLDVQIEFLQTLRRAQERQNQSK